jgi:uncharacterized RDD family membrane protein YckC
MENPETVFERSLNGYSKEEILEILHGLDREKFPGRYALAYARYQALQKESGSDANGIPDRYRTGTRRFWALVLDGLFISLISLIPTQFLYLSGIYPQVDFSGVEVFVNPIYCVLLVWLFSKTWGKKICSLEILSYPDEGKISFTASLKRKAYAIAILGFAMLQILLPDYPGPGLGFFLNIGFSVLFFIGTLIWFALDISTFSKDPRRRSLHDIFAGTLVVRTK